MGLFIGNPGSLTGEDINNGVGFNDTGIYGVEFSAYASGQNNTAGVRTDDAAFLSWTRATKTDPGTDDFTEKAGPFMVRECLSRVNDTTNEREIVLYENEDGYAAAKATGNFDVMIEFPRFYYNRPSKWKFRVSSKQHDGFLPSPMHFRNGVMHDYVYIAKYALDNAYMSRSGQTPLRSTTLETFRTNIRKRKMYVIDWPTWCSVDMLLLIKYANLNVQSVLGQGNSSSSGPVTNGVADGVQGKSGGIAAVGSQGSVVCMGIENWYSNIWYFIDGYFKNNTTMMINEDIENITSNPNTSTWAGYTPMSSQVPTTHDVMISDIAFESNYPYSLHPTATNSSINVADIYTYQSGVRLSLAGGCYGNDSGCGPLAFDVACILTHSDGYVGSSAFFFK